MNELIIDVMTKDVSKLLHRLRRLKTTAYAENSGIYHQDIAYSQVYLETTRTADEVEDWLYDMSQSIEYIGVTESR